MEGSDCCRVEFEILVIGSLFMGSLTSDRMVKVPEKTDTRIYRDAAGNIQDCAWSEFHSVGIR